MLATHLSFPQIAEEMFLGARSRNQAVERARDIGLLSGGGPGRAGRP
jgi:hypothetical protein